MTRGAAPVPARPVRQPRRGPLLLVRASVLVLPAGGLRDRYRQELVAELYGLSPARQHAHAMSVLAHAWALRSAVAGAGALEEDILDTSGMMPGRPLRCRLNLHHWRCEHTEDGARFRRCLLCGRDAGGSGDGPGDWVAPIRMR